MSYGFLTESSLIPKKAVPIKVDASSVLDLQAIVFQKEQAIREAKDSDRKKVRCRLAFPVPLSPRPLIVCRVSASEAGPCCGAQGREGAGAERGRGPAQCEGLGGPARPAQLGEGSVQPPAHEVQAVRQDG